MKFTAKQRSDLFSMFDGRCAYCGVKLPDKGWHADHVGPILRKAHLERSVGRFGAYKRIQTGECFLPENDHIGNIMPACRSCNIDKSSMDLETWRKTIEAKPRVLRDNHSAWRHAERFGLVAQIATTVTFYFESAKTKSGAGDTPEVRP